MSVQAFLPPPFTLTRARRSPRPCFSRVPRMSAKMPSPESSVISTQKVKGGLRLLEAPGSIFGALVQTARFAWNGGWKIMMAELAPSSSKGDYVRPTSKFMYQGATDASVPVLFIGYACPWCHRVLLARALLGLQDKLNVVEVVPGKDGLWVFQDGNHRQRWGHKLKDVYRSLAQTYKGRYTAPLLINADPQNQEIISNESADILKLLPGVFRISEGPLEIANGDGAAVWLRPSEDNSYGVDTAKLDSLCEDIYHSVNNGVYKCGFATTQEAYERAERALFASLDRMETILQSSRFLCSGSLVTEADVRLFPTIFRFDAVYAHLFNACRKSVRSDYPAISGWLSDVYEFSGVPETCNLEDTRQSYYTNLFPLNPGGIVPVAPAMEYKRPSARVGLGVQAVVP